MSEVTVTEHGQCVTIDGIAGAADANTFVGDVADGLASSRKSTREATLTILAFLRASGYRWQAVLVSRGGTVRRSGGAS